MRKARGNSGEDTDYKARKDRELSRLQAKFDAYKRKCGAANRADYTVSAMKTKLATK